MRSRFPVLWVLQLALLLVAVTTCLFFPSGVLERYTGRQAPDAVERPSSEVTAWVLAIQAVPMPSRVVRTFFRMHPEEMGGSASEADAAPPVWSNTDDDDDPVFEPMEFGDEPLADVGVQSKSSASIVRLPPSSAPVGDGDLDIEDDEWEQVTQWILDCTPAPDQDVKDWFNEMDQVARPTDALAEWVFRIGKADKAEKSDKSDSGGEQKALAPHRDFRQWLLTAEYRLPTTWRLATDQVRARAPGLLAVALFTLLGLLSPSIRRPLARIFFLVFLIWSIAHLRGMLGVPDWNSWHIALGVGLVVAVGMVMSRMRDCPGEGFGWTLFVILILWQVGVTVLVIAGGHSPYGEVAFAVMCGLALLNAYYWLIGPSQDPPQDNAGIAQSRPPQLWTTWGIQFLFLFVVGLAVSLFPGDVLELLTDAEHDRLATKMVDDQMRLNGAGAMGLALFSFFSMRALSDWLWRGIAWIFVFVFSCLALQTVFSAVSGEYTIWMFVFGFQGLFFVPTTLKLLNRDDPWFADNVEKSQEGWSLSDLLVALPLLGAAMRGRRRVFATGVAAAGRFRVLGPEDRAAGEPSPPTNAFFEPGRDLTARMRFSNFSLEDDAALDLRGCALQLRHSGTGDELTLLMSTGAFCPAADPSELRLLLRSGDAMRGSLLAQRHVREGMAAGLRRAPPSYLSLHYYSQTVRHWWDDEGVRYLARFRLVPPPAETSDADLPLSDDDLDQPWPRSRLDSESRAADYLRSGLTERMAADEPCVLQLEVRSHDPEEGDSEEWYDPTEEWQEADHPWVALGRVHLSKPIVGEEARRLRFDPLRQPGAIKVPKARLSGDPRWLGAVQSRIVRSLSALRVRDRLGATGQSEDDE